MIACLPSVGCAQQGKLTEHIDEQDVHKVCEQVDLELHLRMPAGQSTLLWYRLVQRAQCSYTVHC